jgi:hypothetical protein
MLIKIIIAATVGISLSAEYPPDNRFYIIEKQTLFSGADVQKDYKYYAKLLLDTKAFSKQEINEAINRDKKKGLSAFLRAVAYDRANDLKNAELATDQISDDTEAFAKLTEIVPIKLAIADLYLRQNKPKSIAILLPPKEFLGYESSYSLQAQYYYGMAHYLETGEFNNYFLTAKNYFKPAKNIYYKKNKRIKGVDNYAQK